MKTVSVDIRGIIGTYYAPCTERRYQYERSNITEAEIVCHFALASGLTFENLKFETAIAAQTLGRIIIETCEAVTRVLKNYIQVRRNDKRLY